jgi:ATP-dependent Clp protease ATP-binding subunit ClpC
MQLMSIEDLAAYLGDSKRTIYKYIASGDCPAYIRISSKNIKFDRADVDAWLESKKVTPELKEINMKEKLPWTPRAKRVLKVAQQEAHRCKLDYVGTEHQLLAIVEVEECLGAIILKNLGVAKAKLRKSYEQLRDPVSLLIGSKTSGSRSCLSDRAQIAVRCASEEAIRQGHEYIGAEHLLAGVLLVGDGLGYRILTKLGITLDRVRSETAKLIVCWPASDKVC